MINTADYLTAIHALLDEHDFPRDRFRIVPKLERAGMSWEGSILVRDKIGEEEGLPLMPTERVREVLLSNPELMVRCLVLHEMFHCLNHFTPVDQLSGEERIARDFDADHWALEQMGLNEY